MRDYMRDFDSSMTGWFTLAVKWLIYICVGVFLLQLVFGQYSVLWFGASAATTLGQLKLWQLLTYMFLHGSVGHLFVNMLGLWFFGTRLEERWGTERFVKFVAVTGAGSVLIHLLLSIAVTGGRLPADFIIGISGVCYGIFLAFAMYYPEAPIYVYAIFPVKAKVLVGVMILITFLSSIGTQMGGIAHWTHLGGLIFGYLFVKFPDFFDRIPSVRLKRRRRGPQIREGNRWRDF